MSSFSGVNSGDICSMRDTCDDNCQDICYGHLESDCRQDIQEYCNDEWVDGDDAGLVDCLTTNFGDLTSCCSNSFVNENSTYGDCLIPRGNLLFLYHLRSRQ